MIIISSSILIEKKCHLFVDPTLCRFSFLFETGIIWFKVFLGIDHWVCLLGL